MAEKKMPSFVGMEPAKDEPLGRVQLAPEVLEVIIGIATNEVEGVAYTRGNFASGVIEKFGRTQHGKGVKTSWNEQGLVIDVYCVVKNDVSVHQVAVELQQQVRNTIYNMTSIETSEINVHITGIETEGTNVE